MDYVRLLKYFYAYFSAVEKEATPYITPDVLPDYNERRNASHILSDIGQLGGTIGSLPAAVPPIITNSLQAMSALYVLEGSTVGGPYIVQMLKKGGIEKGFSFFSGYGESAQLKWETFLYHLDRFGEGKMDKMSAFETALSTFRNFGQVFDVPTLEKQQPDI
ncbi:biliverdin-producing heme oxygenase [Sphingobacterium daejeonense]|uniref:biliverdin-producing heme oxygenase n=1 Tax=Sphingobacterium daejeonense TaxID=371142 RepID=UPI0010C32DE6|nr:biliverdin-producing heme oxygenase [Sphingobacterium daejeonense]VTP91700.1 Heme oxygenase [Sphingobacterium daejeonense]